MRWICFLRVFFFKQKTAYEMRISDWSSDVCVPASGGRHPRGERPPEREDQLQGARAQSRQDALAAGRGQARGGGGDRRLEEAGTRRKAGSPAVGRGYFQACGRGDSARPCGTAAAPPATKTKKNPSRPK